MKRWIGREVKRFLDEAHIHLPVLLRAAAAPADLVGGLADLMNDDGEMVLDAEPDDSPQALTPDEVEAEQREQPHMYKNAERWDRFLAYTRISSEKWPDDSDATRRSKAVEYFNAGAAVARDLYELNPTLASWVPHIMVFIVPRQVVALGNPAKRSCDACESIGSTIKHIIKDLTCRRRHGNTVNHTRGENLWRQSFNKGYIQQAFERVSVRHRLLRGEENQPFLQRQDARLLGQGRTSTAPKTMSRVAPYTAVEPLEKPPPVMSDAQLTTLLQDLYEM